MAYQRHSLYFDLTVKSVFTFVLRGRLVNLNIFWEDNEKNKTISAA